MVRIHVGQGKERKTWILNEDLLCDRVNYFRAGFKSDFKEGKHKQMDLPEDDPSAFGKVVDGIYKRFLDCPEHQPTWASSSPSLSIKPIETEHQVLWCKVWIMADKLGMTDLACQTILQYRRCLENSTITIGPTVINFVYENTLEGSDLRELLFHRAMQQFYDSSKEPDLKGLGDVTAGNYTFNGEMLLRVGGI
jgi:hypothetical protein